MAETGVQIVSRAFGANHGGTVPPGRSNGGMIMAITSDTETRQTTTLVVTVRVPNGADGDLTTNAERRLSRADGIFAVTVEELRDLQPGLSATNVTVRIRVETAEARTTQSVEDTLAGQTGVEVTN